MGMLFRLFAPRGLKKARRAMHPVSLLTPRPVRKAKMSLVDITHPVGATKRAAKRQVVRSVRGSSSHARTTPQQRSPRARAETRKGDPVPAVMSEPSRPTGSAVGGPSTWTFRADPEMAWTFLTLAVSFRPGSTVSASDAAMARQALDQFGTGRTIDECVELLRACPDAADECETMAICTESYAQEHDTLANNLRAGGQATASEVISLETAVEKRHDELVAEAQALSAAAIRMRLAALLLQKEYVDGHPDELDTNQLLMLNEHMEVLLAELKSR